MKHRIYLDTHFIDYLWDHRYYIWEHDKKSIKAAMTADVSNQLNEYVTLTLVPHLFWINNWRIGIGEKVFEELDKVTDMPRRKALLRYAEQLNDLNYMVIEDLDKELIRSNRFATRQSSYELQLTLLGLEEILSEETMLRLLPQKDRPLVKEAIAMGCDVFLTTDNKLLKYRHTLEEQLGMRIRKLREFINEEMEQGLVSSLEDIRFFPDLLLYSGMIPKDYDSR